MNRMKTTLDLPEALVVEIRVEAARQGRKLKDLVPEIMRRGLRAQRVSAPLASAAAEKWLDEWVQLGATATRGRALSPSATEILAIDRGRLDRR
jgi:plasmid stability protein